MRFHCVSDALIQTCPCLWLHLSLNLLRIELECTQFYAVLTDNGYICMYTCNGKLYILVLTNLVYLLFNTDMYYDRGES